MFFRSRDPTIYFFSLYATKRTKSLSESAGVICPSCGGGERETRRWRRQDRAPEARRCRHAMHRVHTAPAPDVTSRCSAGRFF